MNNTNTLNVLSDLVDAAAAKYGMEGDVEHASWLAFKAKAIEDADLMVGAAAYAKACIAAMADGLTEYEFITRYEGRVVNTFRKVVDNPRAYRSAIAARKPRCTVQYKEVC